MSKPAEHVDPELARHRAMADRSRDLLLRALEASPEPLDAHVLAERVGLHVNTVRWHLGVLIDAGLVVRERSEQHVRGRPRHGYRLAGVADGQPRYGMLAEILVDAFAHRDGDAGGSLEAAGRARGRTLVRPLLGGDGPAGDDDEAIGVVVRSLQRLGFHARRERGEGGHVIAMRPCPFGELGSSHSSIVCPIHLGLIRGVLDTLRSDVEATSLEPFVEPHLCVARLRLVEEADAGAG